MAAVWIPMRVDLAEDPAVIVVAQRTGIDEYGVIGRLHRLWGWANAQLRSGCAQGVTPEWVDRYLATPGFAAALLEVDWLRTRSGCLEIPNFDRWNSQNAKQRVLAAGRMRRIRSENVAQAAQQKRHQRREEKRTNKEPLPLPFQTEQFRKSWDEWTQYRREKGSALKDSTIKKQFAFLLRMGERGAIESIEQSIRNGWAGLFSPKGQAKDPADPTGEMARRYAGDRGDEGL